MARAVNVILQVNDRQYDLNKMGLVSMSFDRYLGSQEDLKSGIFTRLDMTTFDATGHTIAKILQDSESKINVRYGFDDDMSEPYILNVIKYNSTYNNLGAMVGISAVGSQIFKSWPAETYVAGTRIKDILKHMALRNGWYIGIEGSKEYIDIELVLPIILSKKEGIRDMEFIVDSILPLCNQAATRKSDAVSTIFWDVKLTPQNGRVEFFFRPYTKRGTTKRVWKYTYGVSPDNSILNITNKVDMSFLLNGLTLEIPGTIIDSLIGPNAEEAELKKLVSSKFNVIQNLLQRHGLPIINPADFRWNIEVVETENIGNTSIEELLLSKLEETMRVLNTLDLTVIGNPRIMPHDLIDLTIMNKDGNINILSSSAATGSYWRVVGITEEIGLNGYETKLKLVREYITNV